MPHTVPGTEEEPRDMTPASQEPRGKQTNTWDYLKATSGVMDTRGLRVPAEDRDPRPAWETREGFPEEGARAGI